ncbi:RHS repeat domain-containing protein [Pectobacterium parmentieri]|uniref:RHS repeat domain-containing protein n=1 Tax=Pectobacterium parmentieri TaxID=1905730 RepID=UPI0040470645
MGIGSHQPLQFSHTAAGEEQRRSNGCGFSLRHEWSPTGLLQRQALEGADGRVNDVLERRYQYDVLDRLTGISDSHWGEQAFRLNGAGQVTAERRDEGRRRQARLFGYDSEQNLCEVSQIAPGLAQTLKVQDAVVQASARYDAAGRVVERGHTQYQYDDCGRLAVKRETRPGFRPKETHFDWDVQDRLVRVSLPDGARWRYRYDVFGRRINKVREGQVPSTQAVARVAYRWDGDQLIGQQQYRADGSAAREVQWVYEPGSFRPLAQVEAQGGDTQLHYIVTDLAGTARELCSEEGDVHWRGEQGLWGAHREERRPIPLRRYLGDAANEEVYCELRYQGQLYDAETGLYYNRHRYYDAESGQYLSPDPIGLLGGLRPQGYVTNPLGWIDPLGLSGEDIFIHNTDKAGFDRIMSTGVIEANSKGKVYITDILMSPQDAMRNIFINDPAHTGRGDYSIIFKADSTQMVNIFQSSELEHIHSGRLKLGEVLHAGKNPYDVVSHLSYEQRLNMTQEQINSRGDKCG